MIGRGYVRCQLPLKDLCLDPWTLDSVRKVLDKALDERDRECQHMWQVFMDQAHEDPIHRVQAFLGEPQDVTRGTMGEPQVPPVYVKIMQDALEDAVLKASMSYFDPPLNNMESARRCLAQYMFVFIERF